MAASTTPLARALSIPVLLLKTKSSPTDAYEELFTASTTPGGGSFEPIFVPVLQHRFNNNGVSRLKDLLVDRRITAHCRECDADSYGGLIFTSQRAVEAFASAVADGKKQLQSAGRYDDKQALGDESWPYLQDVPIYSVGPATTRALRAVAQEPALTVLGDHTGNGEDLAYFIREHYGGAQRKMSNVQNTLQKPLLFVVGEKRRDIIPKVLMGGGGAVGAEKDSTNLPRIHVDELTVYDTGIMPSFVDSLSRVLETTQDRPVRWIIVFSPTGCKATLGQLGLLDHTTTEMGQKEGGKSGRTFAAKDGRSTLVATIGPTTRAFLVESFGFEPDVCAEEPTPKGLLQGISQFMALSASTGK